VYYSSIRKEDIEPKYLHINPPPMMTTMLMLGFDPFSSIAHFFIRAINQLTLFLIMMNSTSNVDLADQMRRLTMGYQQSADDTLSSWPSSASFELDCSSDMTFELDCSKFDNLSSSATPSLANSSYSSQGSTSSTSTNSCSTTSSLSRKRGVQNLSTLVDTPTNYGGTMSALPRLSYESTPNAWGYFVDTPQS
jgi:hypothetical protein